MPEGAGGSAINEAAYDAYADHVYAYAFTLVGSPEAAEDAVAHAFLTALERDLSLPRNEFRLRLYQLTRTACLTAENPGDASGASFGRELFELNERHGLSAADIASVVGLSEDVIDETLQYGERPAGLRATVGKAPATLRRRVLSTAPAGFLASTLRMEELAETPAVPPREPKRRLGWLWPAAAVVAIALLGVALANLLSPDGEGPRGTTARPTLSVTLGGEQPQSTLTPGPTSTLTAATPTSSASLTPTPTQKPSPTPSPTPAATAPPTATRPALAISPGSITLARRGGDARGSVVLTASGGPVSWTATPSEGAYLSVSPSAGILQPGESRTLRVSIRGNPPDSRSYLFVVFSPGGLTVTINLQ